MSPSKAPLPSPHVHTGDRQEMFPNCGVLPELCHGCRGRNTLNPASRPCLLTLIQCTPPHRTHLSHELKAHLKRCIKTPKQSNPPLFFLLPTGFVVNDLSNAPSQHIKCYHSAILAQVSMVGSFTGHSDLQNYNKKKKNHNISEPYDFRANI